MGRAGLFEARQRKSYICKVIVYARGLDFTVYFYRSVPNATSAIAASHRYATKPHMAGTPGDLDTAKDFLALLQRELRIEASYSSEPIYPAGSSESRHATLSIPTTSETKAWIDVYYPVLNTPLARGLEILGDDGKPVWHANLEEVVDEEDPEAHKYADAIPAFHGLSANGEVEGKLVYANYGRKSDYDALVEAGISCAVILCQPITPNILCQGLT